MSHTPPGPAAQPGFLADRLRTLRDKRRKPDGSQYTHQEIADGMCDLYRESRRQQVREELTARQAPPQVIEQALASVEEEKPFINRAYISQMLSGAAPNPTLQILNYLAAFFGLKSARYFVDEEVSAEVEGELDALQALRELLADAEGGKQALAFARTAQGLDPTSRQSVLNAALMAAQAAVQAAEVAGRSGGEGGESK